MKDKDTKILEEAYKKINEESGFSSFDINQQSDEFIPPEYEEGSITDKLKSKPSLHQAEIKEEEAKNILMDAKVAIEDRIKYYRDDADLDPDAMTLADGLEEVVKYIEIHSDEIIEFIMDA